MTITEFFQIAYALALTFFLLKSAYTFGQINVLKKYAEAVSELTDELNKMKR